MFRRSLPLAALAVMLAAAGASAQDHTGGAGPAGTTTARQTSSVGQTKPPASGAGAATADAPRTARTKEQVQDDKISQGICIGCGPK